MLRSDKISSASAICSLNLVGLCAIFLFTYLIGTVFFAKKLTMFLCYYNLVSCKPVFMLLLIMFLLYYSFSFYISLTI